MHSGHASGNPDQGEILVTGAAGGVAFLAIVLPSGLGYTPAALSGKAEAFPFLKALGARSLLRRDEAEAHTEKPILKARWAGAVDTVGGYSFESDQKTHYGGTVTCCGLVASLSLSLTVFPFILRNVVLYGIDSAACGRGHLCKVLWEKLAGEWRSEGLAAMSCEIDLNDGEKTMDLLLKGAKQGRTVLRVTSV